MTVSKQSQRLRHCGDPVSCQNYRQYTSSLMCNSMPDTLNPYEDLICRFTNLNSLEMKRTNNSETEHDGLDNPASLLLPDEDGDTPLHVAIICEDVPAAFEIIDKAESHIFLSYQNHLRQSPLHLAVLTKQLSVVRGLVTSGADFMTRDRNGNTPLHLACREGFVDVAKSLLEPVSPLEAIKTDREIPNQFISQRLDVKNYDGLSCIHLAANKGNVDIVNLLLEKGADCNDKEMKTGRCILHNACFSGNVELVRMLTRLKSCNINAKAYDGLTAFDLARSRSHDTICMVLAAAGARYGYEDMDDL